MAELRNDSGALRLAVELVSRDPATAPGAGPGGASPGAPAGRLLATAALEYLDRRDGEWWPLVRLPPARFAEAAAARLLDELGRLLQGASGGFAWRPGEEAGFAIQLGADEGGAVLEVGLDLGAFLADAAGVAWRPEAELALFRFRAAQADLVRFSDALSRELEALRR